jgi:hypothetical protein
MSKTSKASKEDELAGEEFPFKDEVFVRRGDVVGRRSVLEEG